ncbi:MAG: hypothetical protein GY710_12115 [Desulfobacteraceae bacterium]|nr:hypothetical protein [Desulfobacteraceae bacterium]
MANNKQTPHKKSGSARKGKETLIPIEELAKANGLASWEAAAIFAATGWAPGKQVSETQFSSVLTQFKHRPQGGGRIKA